MIINKKTINNLDLTALQNSYNTENIDYSTPFIDLNLHNNLSIYLKLFDKFITDHDNPKNNKYLPFNEIVEK